MKLKVLAAGAIAALTLVGVAGNAFAAPPNSGYDDKPDRAEGAGSDTTYAHMQLTERLYNQAQGCDTNNTAGSPTVGQCLAVGSGQSIDPNGTTGKFGNWDHDYTVSRYPTGSTAGVRQLQAGTADYARSSRGPNATGETDVNFWAYGKDGIAIVTMNGRTGANITKAQLQGIYNCSITTWDQITGLPADVGKTIQPVGMNPASGTKATFQTYLGFDPNAGACVKKLALTGNYPFENDLKPVLDPANGIDTANAIWWMSYAEFKAYSYKRQSAALWQVDGKSLTNATVSANTWPITRFIYHVALKTTVDAAAGTETWAGATGNAQGAVRDFTRFICSTSGNHIPNDFTGVSNYDELSNVYSQTGFIRVPSTERTNGVCRKVPG